MDKYILQCGEILFSFHLLQRSCRRARCESEAVAEERVIPRDSSATDAYQRSCCLLLVLLVPTNALAFKILFLFFFSVDFFGSGDILLKFEFISKVRVLEVMAIHIYCR